MRFAAIWCLQKQFEEVGMARPVNTEIAVQRQDLADAPSLSYGNQRSICKIHGQVDVFRHQTLNLKEVANQGSFYVEGAPEYEVPQRGSFRRTIKEVKHLG